MTQIETIEWHEYPKEKPQNAVMPSYLIQYRAPEGYTDIVVGEHLGEFWNSEIDLSECEIIAWAEMPKGWRTK